MFYLFLNGGSFYEVDSRIHKYLKLKRYQILVTAVLPITVAAQDFTTWLLQNTAIGMIIASCGWANLSRF